MEMAVREIRVTEVRLPDALEAQIDKDIEQSEREIENGDYLEAHEAFRKIREGLAIV